ncbi:MAG: M20 family metallopeptidase [Conexivisphaera sp.]
MPSCSYEADLRERSADALASLGRGRLLEILGQLVSVPTVNPPGQSYGEMAEVLQSIMEEAGYDVKVIEVPRDYLERHIPEYADHPRYLVLARLGSGRPVVHFNSHYDVVPPGDGWTKDPFRLTVDGDLVYGRGVVDMKGGMATAILAAQAAAVAGADQFGSVELSFTPDEETGGETGVKYMVDSGIVSPDYVIVPEASGLNNIWIGNKGHLWAEVEVRGRQAHGSTPWLGLNAFEGMARLAISISEALSPRLSSRRSSYPFADPREASSTINIGGAVSGGAKVNLVPGRYSFTIDRRLIPEEDLGAAEAELRGAVEAAAAPLRERGYAVEMRITSASAPSVVSPEGRLASALSAAVREVTGSSPRLTVCPGGLDTRYFQLAGIEALTYGPGDTSRAHAADEANSISEMMRVAAAYAALIPSLLSPCDARGPRSTSS